MSKPFELSFPMLPILAESEAWVFACRAPTHPIALTFYVPAHLSERFTRAASGLVVPDHQISDPAALRLI